MRYALEVTWGVYLLTGYSPLPSGAIEPIPNWDDLINIPWYYLKVDGGSIVEKSEAEKQAYHDANPPTIDELQEIAQYYLDETDWYVIRKYETGREIPFDVENERIQQRVILGETQ